MKICVISSQVFPCPPIGYAGLEMISWECARGLNLLGHDVTLIAPEGSSCPWVNKDPSLPSHLPSGPPGQWDEKKAYEGYWQHLTRYDVIISHDWGHWPYILKGEGVLKAPVLGVLHAPVNTCFSSLPPDVPRPCFVCISRDQASHFQGIYSREARVCHNGIDLDTYKPLGTPRSDRFLFLARFSAIKGPHLAIEACKKAGVGLDLVGDTSITNEPDYLKQCMAWADGEQIRFVGPAARGECVYWFSRARALLHPVRDFREPFGLAPVECMACGTPVISWDNGGMRETVRDRETGFLVRSMEEMVSAIHAMKTWEEVGSCRERASLFSVQKMALRYQELCLEALDTRGW